ncbi:sensor histidine kinase [Erysipelothrix urinaevulpis]
MKLLILSTSLSVYLLIYLTFKNFSRYADYRKYGKILVFVLMPLNSVFFAHFQAKYYPTFVAYLVFLVLMFIWFMVVFNTSATLAYFGAIHYVFYLFVMRSGVMSVYSLFVQIPIAVLKQGGYHALMIFQISAMLVVVLFVYWNKFILTTERMNYVFANPGQLRYILFNKTILGLYMMVITFGSRYTLNEIWYSSVHLITAIIVGVVAYSALQNGISVSESLEHEKQTVALQNQLSMQISHYRSYQKYTEGFREFRHDYKRMLSTINSLLRNNQFEEAIHILDEMGVTLASNEVAHKQYSNYPLLDAVFQEYANRCVENEIHFDGILYWDEAISMDELTIVRLFTNLLTNAFEAAGDSQARYITVSSNARDHWLDIVIKNSFDGNIHDDLSSTKTTTEGNRGLGTKIVSKTMESIGGVFSWDTQDQEFIAYLHIPRR